MKEVRTIYVDADACPVKNEIYRVAARHGIKVIVVSNSPIAVPREPMIERVVVGAGMDAADHWIVERVSGSTQTDAASDSAPSPKKLQQVRGDIVITADIPLASRCVKAGAEVIAPNGRPFTEAAIGMTLAVRNLMHDLRSAAPVESGFPLRASRHEGEWLRATFPASARATSASMSSRMALIDVSSVLARVMIQPNGGPGASSVPAPAAEPH